MGEQAAENRIRQTGGAQPSAAIAVVLTLLTGFGPMSTDLYLPSLPALVTAFGSDIATVQLTLSVFLVGFAAAQLIYGPLSDRIGRRPAILAGITIFTGASIACALATSIEMLILCRFLQALGACSGPVLGRAVVRDLYGPGRSARILAYMSMAMALAPAIGPMIGGVLQQAFGWPATFWLLVGFGAVMLVSVLALLGESNRHRDPLATSPARLVRNYGALLRHRRYVGYVLIVACSYSAIFTFISGSSFVLSGMLGLSPPVYGACFGIVCVGYICGTFGAGRLTLRLGIDRMIAAGTLVMLAGAALMTGLAAAGVFTVWAVVGPFVLVMAGIGLTFPNAIAGAIGPFPTMAGTASALMGFIQMTLAALVGIAIGQATSPATGGLPMALAVLLTSLGALAAFRLLVRPSSGRPAGTA
ncbi:DHA1 family bicyclomycin/chloramphenicol resistance-like MFS transporter [Inquilinus ginsengisoli]|uniref:Bcr/CflA family efflux transporter n=1 Tax=Inquilinus ginsengisoli TaxID=363840 RepID=A0ABU1JXX3_9PROT|nr:multidrug effflux MFS transporter [Inquilinus ginsengisoli]MDR6293482.1 DHA1 family bicyclomycin/chloramphenicol resistance-like MFS transporter [Inquilinus ginsengisoli]